MHEDDEITRWIEGVARGDSSAAQRIWDRYFQQLCTLARKRMAVSSRRVTDEEDVALSAMDSFCRAAAAGRFPRLADRDDLWRLLVTITARKALAHLKLQYRQKRGGGQVRGESVFLGKGEREEPEGIDGALGSEPTPELAAQFSEQCDRLLEALPDPTLRRVASQKLEGYTNAEIAGMLGCATITVERKLARIRQIWRSFGVD